MLLTVRSDHSVRSSRGPELASVSCWLSDAHCRSWPRQHQTVARQSGDTRDRRDTGRHTNHQPYIFQPPTSILQLPSSIFQPSASTFNPSPSFFQPLSFISHLLSYFHLRLTSSIHRLPSSIFHFLSSVHHLWLKFINISKGYVIPFTSSLRKYLVFDRQTGELGLSYFESKRIKL